MILPVTPLMKQLPTQKSMLMLHLTVTGFWSYSAGCSAFPSLSWIP